MTGDEFAVEAPGENTALDRIASWYESSIPIRVGAIALGPITGGITAVLDQAIASTFAFLRRSRLRAFRDELITLNLSTTEEEEVRSKEFVELLWPLLDA